MAKKKTSHKKTPKLSRALIAKALINIDKAKRSLNQQLKISEKRVSGIKKELSWIKKQEREYQKMADKL